ncbi:DeoR/GlpR family DNA-binding transcription regulator [Biostraticola tofi]|uniref:DeoR family transcriptional regulator n=1 Tax=Biostraticola tofi TaxID=466109 RepID=A0A4R3YW10_9GAMM|nr:DeoR/GlpR family DNA-binding transcription regulator [Biostraticola tofi]TCV96780.1 DeoR family transcriptional regulator [Biostraticola tofi]
MKLAESRRQKILDLLSRHGELQASALADKLSISEDTVRRDLIRLESTGMLTRVRGGAIPRSPVPLYHQDRLGRTGESKQAIAIMAVSLIRMDDVVALDGGTTTLAIAEAIPARLRCTVVTNNLPAALALAIHPAVEVIVLGGKLFKPAMDMVGHKVCEELRAMAFDISFVGATSANSATGLSSIDYDEVQVKRALVASAERSVCVVSGEKLGKHSPFSYASANEINDIITDSDAPPDVIEQFRDRGVNVMLADTAPLVKEFRNGR